MLFLHAGGYGATLSWGGLPTDAVALKARAVEDGLEELFVRLEVLCMAEYNVPVLVKPRLSLDSNRTQGDQVNEHGQQGCNNGESDHERSELQASGTIVHLDCATKLNLCGISLSVEHCVEGELGHGSLTKRDVVRALKLSVRSRHNTQHAERHGLRVVDIG